MHYIERRYEHEAIFVYSKERFESLMRAYVMYDDGGVSSFWEARFYGAYGIYEAAKALQNEELTEDDAAQAVEMAMQIGEALIKLATQYAGTEFADPCQTEHVATIIKYKNELPTPNNICEL